MAVTVFLPNGGVEVFQARASRSWREEDANFKMRDNEVESKGLTWEVLGDESLKVIEHLRHDRKNKDHNWDLVRTWSEEMALFRPGSWDRVQQS